MPYVAGQSLRHRLRHEKQLSIDEAMGITRDVASALAAAHAGGVLHSDIKPENILLHEGRAMVAGFGIARALTQAGGAGVEGLNEGCGIRTPGIMSAATATAAPN